MVLRQLFVSWSMPLLVFVWLLAPALICGRPSPSGACTGNSSEIRANGQVLLADEASASRTVCGLAALSCQVRGGVFEAFLNLNQAQGMASCHQRRNCQLNGQDTLSSAEVMAKTVGVLS